MILTGLYILTPLRAWRPLQHWLYALHILIMLGVSWYRFPSLDYAVWHAYYIPFIGAAHLLSISAVTFLAYGWDKFQARRGGWRVPEATLHALAFLGGSFAAWSASRFFRHKTIKGSFRQMFAAVVIVQLGVVLGVIWWLNI